jgi:mycothiol synthase
LDVTIRPYHAEDLSAVTAVLNRSGESWTEERLEQDLDEPGERARENAFVAVSNERIVGHIRYCFTNTTTRHHFHVFGFGAVDPAYRGQGVGTRLIRHGIGHLTRLLEKEGLTATLIQHVDAHNHALIRILEREGLDVAILLRGLRLEREQAVDLPDAPHGFRVRPVEWRDASAIARVDQQAFGWREEAEVLTAEGVRHAWTAPDFDPALFSVVETDAKEVIGYVDTTVHLRKEKRIGRIHSLAIAPTYQGRGLGRWLLARSVQALRSVGTDAVELTVETDNPTAAMGLYASLGFRPVREWHRYVKHLEPNSAVKDPLV